MPGASPHSAARPRRQTEHVEQRALVTWARAAAETGYADAPEGRRKLTERQRLALDCLYAIPNGGGRSKAEAGRLRAEGVNAGTPDLCLPFVAGDGTPALYIEMKAPGGRVSAAQSRRIGVLRTLGYRVVVCVGYREGRDAILDYLASGATTAPDTLTPTP